MPDLILGTGYKKRPRHALSRRKSAVPQHMVVKALDIVWMYVREKRTRESFMEEVIFSQTEKIIQTIEIRLRGAFWKRGGMTKGPE